MVLGASFDSEEENREFAEAQGFDFPLLCDVDRAVGAAYEVTRAANDQFAHFPLRISYLIDPDGIIRRSYGVTDVNSHAEEVLADVVRLGAA